MYSTEKDHLLKALNKLCDKQFEEFKWRLKFINYNREENISTAALGKTKRSDVVDLLIQYYENNAVDVCIKVLQKSNINDVAKSLEEIQQKVADVDDDQSISDYRNYIKNTFEKMKDPNAIPGEYVLLNERYSKLIILDYHRSEEETEHEILATGRKHVELISKRAKSSASIENFFNPDKHGFIPQVVVLQGAAGIGKTMMAKKIMLDWASRQLYQDKFNYVFYISCREMNLHAESQKASIAEIISKEWLKCHKGNNVIQNILKNEKKLLFIIDGFDELKYSFDQPEDSFCIDPWKKEPVRIVLSSLFKKKLLPKSSLIITTRPTALEKLNQCLGHLRYFEILGFSTQERQEFFKNFFGNKKAAMEAFNIIKQNDTLFTMCVIPLVSWIICTVMKQEMERGKDLQKTPYTLTAIYMLYLSSLLKFHHKECKQDDVQSYVKGLCSLAAQGVWNQEILFLEEKVKEHNLDQGDSLPLFLNQSLFKRGIDCIKTYSFIHLSFQEFFAALFYLLEEGEEQHSQNQGKKFQALLKRHKFFRPNFAVGFHFLFGFLNEEKTMTGLKQEFGWKISPKNKEFLLDYVKNNFEKSRSSFQLQKEMFSYLYETQDNNFVKNAVHGITEIIYQCNLDMDLMILAYFVYHCQNLEHLHVEVPKVLYVSKTNLVLSENEEWSLKERNVEELFKALPKLTKLRRLCLVGWSFTESCSRYLAEVFKKNQRLKVFQLSLDDTDDKAAELLCEGLQEENCKVETLVFTGDTMTEFCSMNVAKVLSKNQGLRELKFRLFYPDDAVVKILCEGLQHKNCSIEKLGLAREFLTKLSSRHLAEVLKKNQRLREIEFCLKKIDEKEAEFLYDLLKLLKCGLETLQLFGQFLTESGSSDPADILAKSERLRELVLPLKNTFDKIIDLLPELLKCPECVVNALWHFEKFLGKSCYTHIAEIVRKNQKMESLGLFFNNPDEKTAELLLEGFRDLEYKTRMIQLAGEFMIESGSIHLAQIIRKNQSMRELESLLNNTVAKMIELFLEGFKDPECTREALRLLEHFLNESWSKVLATLRKNQGLRELESFLKNTFAKSIESMLGGFKHPEYQKETVQHIGQFLNECSTGLLALLSKEQGWSEIESFLRDTNDQTMKVLCEGLKDSECKIETLHILGEIPTESCSSHFADVLRKNQRLRVLKLSLKNPVDETIKLLYDGLKHSECTIETLQLAGKILTEYCRRHLADVFKKNQRLRVLKLSLKNPDDKTMELLYEGLKHSQCTIETLQLDGEFLTESCSRHLAEIFRKNQRLRKLELSVKNPDDKKMKPFCEGLKHPQCKIETLQLNGKYIIQNGEWMDVNHTARAFLVIFFCFFILACLIYFYFY